MLGSPLGPLPGLGNGDFDVPASLRRAGSLFRLTAGLLRKLLLDVEGPVPGPVDAGRSRALLGRRLIPSAPRTPGGPR